jgi:RND family efflux transporter MFP subunit
MSPPRCRALPVLPLLAAGSLAVLTGCPDENQFEPPPPPTVTVAAPAVREVTTYQDFTGRLQPTQTVELRARVRGFLQSIEFEPSQRVEAGQLLFTIDKKPFQAEVSLAEADVGIQRAALSLAELTLERAAKAHEQKAVSDIELAERTAQRDAAEAAVDAAEASLDSARIDLGYTDIKAPGPGRISRNLVDVGNLVGSGEPTLLSTIVQDDPIRAYFNISERWLLAYQQARERADKPREERQGARTEVFLQLLDGSDYEESGFVDWAENRIDPDTGTLEARAEFPNANGLLYPGMFGRVRIPLQTSDALLVPEYALQRDLAGTFLLVVVERTDEASGEKKDVVMRRDVMLGPSDAGERVIVSGVEADDRVIVSGLQRARPGIAVTVESADTDADAGTDTGAE